MWIGFDAFASNEAPDDSALECSHWIANRTRATIDGGELFTAPSPARAIVEERLRAAGPDGVVFFTHGAKDKLGDALKQPILDRENVHLLGGRWVHAIACSAGTELAGLAVIAGARCFVGYEASLFLEWHPSSIPEGLLDLFSEMVTTTTRSLAESVFAEPTLRQRAFAAAGRVLDWLDRNPDVDGWRFQITAQQLRDRLVVRPSADAPDL